MFLDGVMRVRLGRYWAALVVRGTVIEFGDQHGELTIGDAAKCAPVAVPGLT
jgi:hypothetical protein